VCLCFSAIQTQETTCKLGKRKETERLFYALVPDKQKNKRDNMKQHEFGFLKNKRVFKKKYIKRR
jgi:hypothetical protein